MSQATIDKALISLEKAIQNVSALPRCYENNENITGILETLQSAYRKLNAEVSRLKFRQMTGAR